MDYNKVTISIQRQTICKGCKQYNLHGDCPFLPIIHKGTDKEKTCPCSVCLVKGMCSSINHCELMNRYLICLDVKALISYDKKESI
jgi:hypothetical protein